MNSVFAQFSADMKRRQLASAATEAARAKLMVPQAPPRAAKDPLGLDDWSASHSLSPSMGLALVATSLANIAGPSFRFSNAPLIGGAPGLNLVGMAGDHFLAGAVSDLNTQPMAIQHTLVIKSKEFTAAELDDAMFDHQLLSQTFTQVQELKKPRSGSLSVVWQPEHKLSLDLELSEKSPIHERLTRPRFITSGSVPAALSKYLADCHMGFGFASGSVERLPPSTGKRNLRLDELLRYLNGVETEVSSSRTRTVIRVESLVFRAILMFPKEDFQRLISERRDFFSRAIPVRSLAADADLPEVDEEQAERFRSRFIRVGNQVLSCRRAYSTAFSEFQTRAAHDEFLRQQRGFLRELQEIPDELRVQELAALPTTMAWALLHLAGTPGQPGLDEYVVTTALSAARSVCADAVRMFRQHDEASLAEKRLKTARKMLKRLTKLGPSKRREIVRGLDQQALALNEPMIGKLVELGIFTESPDGVLAIGVVPFARLSANHLLERP